MQYKNNLCSLVFALNLKSEQRELILHRSPPLVCIDLNKTRVVLILIRGKIRFSYRYFPLPTR